MNLNQLSLKGRIIFGFLMVFVFVASAAGYLFWDILVLRTDIVELSKVHVPKIENEFELKIASLDVTRLTSRLGTDGFSPDKIKETKERIQKAIQFFEKTFEEMSSQSWTDEQKVAIVDLKDRWSEIKSKTTELNDLIGDGTDAEKRAKFNQILISDYFGLYSKFSSSIDKVKEFIHKDQDVLVDHANSMADSGVRVAAISGVLITILLVFIAYFTLKGVETHIQTVAGSLLAELEKLTKSSRELSDASNQLSSASTEQAAAVQETVAALDEVNAMVGKNAENSGLSKEESQQGANAAVKGKMSVDDMITSINEIAQSNDQIMGQIEKSNQEMAEIVKVINDIGDKTKIINDIVFQTKLLSFNASVEAARAGEMGKGFAVVAEEVGNLAAMSGNAAKEISDMLSSSVQRVESIIRDTQTQVSGLIDSAKDKVAGGVNNANKAGEVLDEIVGHVSKVDAMVGEIAVASKEQAMGISEISKAMNNLDAATQQNATSTQKTFTLADELNKQAEAMRKILSSLVGTTNVKTNAEKNPEKKTVATAETKVKTEKQTHVAKPPPAKNVFSLKEAKESKAPAKIESRATVVHQPLSKPTAPTGAVTGDVIGSTKSIPKSDDPRFEDV